MAYRRITEAEAAEWKRLYEVDKWSAEMIASASSRAVGVVFDRLKRDGVTIRTAAAAAAIAFEERRSDRFHGGNGTPEQGVWEEMVQRCTNPDAEHYADYGGRGITVCARWLDFANFIADMGKRPGDRHQIERKDNALGYEPGNCEWVPWWKQHRNKRSNRSLTIGGVTKLVTEWCDEIGVTPKTLLYRVERETDLVRIMRPAERRGPRATTAGQESKFIALVRGGMSARAAGVATGIKYGTACNVMHRNGGFANVVPSAEAA